MEAGSRRARKPTRHKYADSNSDDNGSNKNDKNKKATKSQGSQSKSNTSENTTRKTYRDSNNKQSESPTKQSHTTAQNVVEITKSPSSSSPAPPVEKSTLKSSTPMASDLSNTLGDDNIAADNIDHASDVASISHDTLTLANW